MLDGRPLCCVCLTSTVLAGAVRRPDRKVGSRLSRLLLLEVPTRRAEEMPLLCCQVEILGVS